MPAAPSSETPLRWLGLAGAGLFAAGLAVVYPFVLDASLDAVGVRRGAVALAALAVVSLLLRGPARAGRALGGVGLGLLLVAAAVQEDRAILRLVPAWVYLCLAGFFAASLRSPESVIERGAHWLVPEAPDFIRGYCRRLTALWAAFFVVSASIIAFLALAATPDAWRTFTSRTLWLAMAALTAAEFLVRKTWFRYYARGGPFERIWSAIFPAERTAQGRRSLAAIDEWRARVESTRDRPETISEETRLPSGS